MMNNGKKFMAILHEHTESLKLLLSITSNVKEEINKLRTRLSEAEAKLSYYIEDTQICDTCNQDVALCTCVIVPIKDADFNKN